MRKFFFILLALILIVIGLQIILLNGEKPKTENPVNNTLLNDVYLLSLGNSGILLNDIEVFDGKSNSSYHLFSKISEDCLVYRFYGEGCDVCIDHVISQIKEVFPDFSFNQRIILVGSNLNRRILENYYGKNIQYIKNEYFNIPSEDYYMPCLFMVNDSRVSQLAFIPEMAFQELTKDYLLMIKSRYFENEE